MIGGRYSLDHEIGRGGSGPVWVGRDEVLGRQVALKRIGLLPGADRTDLARAEREARLSARLHHPHVVSVFDVVVDDENDARWLVMEYVDGQDLGRLVQDRGPLSAEEARPLLRQVADALVAAHDAGIVHRDVKPSNILLDRHGQAKLTDFGIARVATDPSITQTGLVTGSPAYLPPEVAQGVRGEEAGDVWSLGATAYYLLAGRPPYESDGGHVLGTVYKIVNEEPPRLPGAGSLAPLLEATMVKDPARRWSMREVRDFLDRGAQPAASDGTRVLPAATAPLTAPAARPTGEKSRRPSDRALLLGVAAVVLVVLIAVLAAWLVGRGSDTGGTAQPKQTPSHSPSPSKSKSSAVPQPTARGIESFIRDYVATVSDDPDAAWQMLTPKFQRESGGIEKYRNFWDPATNGRVLNISADPDALTVSYQVHFDHFHNGPGPTVLDLAFEDGHYKIDGERTAGFKPAG